VSYETRITIEWGDCDKAGLVFYPRYACGSTPRSSNGFVGLV